MAKKILVVEDNPSLIKAILEKFTRSNHQVSYAMDGEEAIARFDAVEPDLVLLDINMPKKNGMEVLEYIRNEKESDVKVIIFSNKKEQDTVEAAQSLGVSEFILKADISLAELVNTVNKLIGEY
jgi:DNA-binding response OmpR family regulator